MKEVFADTYAIMSNLRGAPNYKGLLTEGAVRTGLMNLYEAHFILVSSGRSPSEAEHALRPWSPRTSAVTWGRLQAASALRWKLKTDGRRCSFIDALGYAEALERKIPFLTGDPAFRGLPGVAFKLAATK